MNWIDSFSLGYHVLLTRFKLGERVNYSASFVFCLQDGFAPPEDEVLVDNGEEEEY